MHFLGDEMIICLKPQEEDMVVSANIRLIVSALEPLLTRILNIHRNCILHRIIEHSYNGEQGEWEGAILDLALSAMQAFPSAAFLGTFLMYLYVLVCSCMYLYVLVCTCMYLYVLVCTGCL